MERSQPGGNRHINADPSSQLDVVADDRGVLLPRVALESTTDTTTITNGNVNSLLVYNTNTQNDITPGYYYWYEDKWMRIVNENDIAALDKNTTNESLTVANNELVLTDSDGNTVEIPLSEINIPSILVNNGDGTYTYTNEAGDTVTIDVPADVVNNFEEIISNTEVLNELIENLENTVVGGNVYYDGTTFTYIDDAGNPQTINFNEIVQANETVTLLVNNGDGTYTYTNEADDTVTIDVPADVINNFEDIIENTEVLNELIENLENTVVGGNVYYDGTTFTYIDQAGDTHVVNIQDIVTNEVVTNIQNEGDIYDEIIDLIDENETNTTLAFNNETNILTYTNEEENNPTIDLSPLKVEPWLNQADGEKATANTQNIYQMGSVAVGKAGATAGVALDVEGAVRGGSGHTGDIGANSVAFGQGNEASGENAVAMGSGAIASGQNAVAISGMASGNYSVAMSGMASGNYSVAMRGMASGQNSVAMGLGTEASGTGSVAIGSSTASGFHSTAIGSSTTASENYSTAMGYNTTANGNASTSMGQGTTASGIVSTAMGSDTEASGNMSTAMGQSTTASGIVSTAMGNGTTASGRNSTAMGSGTEASSFGSTAMGVNTTASSPAETVIGINNAITTGDAEGYVETDALFQVGNGSRTDERNNAITVLKNAHTAIGVDGEEEAAKPTELLDLGGEAEAGKGGLKIRNINSEAYEGDTTTDRIVVADANGVLKTVAVADVASEETPTTMEQNLTTGVITYTPEGGATNATTANVVSTDEGNQIKVGTDGGAFYQKENSIVSEAGDYTVLDTDETVLIDATGGATVTIPTAAADNTGRILTIRKMDTAYGVLTFSEAITMANGITFNNTNVNGTMRIQSDGTKWVLIN